MITSRLASKPLSTLTGASQGVWLHRENGNTLRQRLPSKAPLKMRFISLVSLVQLL